MIKIQQDPESPSFFLHCVYFHIVLLASYELVHHCPNKLLCVFSFCILPNI